MVTASQALSTGLFTVSVFCTGLAGVELSGFFPAGSRPAVLRRVGGTALITLLALSSAGLACVALWAAVEALPWTVIVISGGLAVLLAPMGFELVSRTFWDSRRGVLVMFTVTGGLLVTLLHLVVT